MTIIKLDKITKVIQKTTILNNISFPVQQGDIFAFLGINGAGKSTTMNIISTLTKQSSGTITFLNQPYTTHIKKQIGVVFQDNILDDELSIIDNLYHRGRLYYKNKKELCNAIQEVIDLLNLEPLLNKQYAYCSGGEKRLASIARAILSKPKLLILDEPTTGLDVNIRKQIWDVIKTLNNELNMSVFFTSHYMEEAMHANQICIIHHGNIIAIKPLSSFLNTTDSILTINNKVVSTHIKTAKEALLTINSNSELTNFSFQQPSIEDIFMKEIITHE